MTPRNILELAPAERDEPSYCALLREGNDAAAIDLIHRAIARNDGLAMGKYAALLVLGKGVEKNLQQAAAWFREGSCRGDTFSQLALGICLSRGIGVDRDPQKAAMWLYRAGCAGHPAAIGELAQLVELDPRVLGLHFSVEQYSELMKRLKRLRW